MSRLSRIQDESLTGREDKREGRPRETGFRSRRGKILPPLKEMTGKDPFSLGYFRKTF